MFTDRRAAGVEDLVPSLRQTHIRYVMPAVDERDIVRREHFGKELLKCCSTGSGFRTGLDDDRVSAAHSGRYDAYRQEDREVKRTDDQTDAIRHLIDFGEDTRPTHQAAEMNLRSAPSAQT